MDGLEAGAWLKRAKVAIERYWTAEFSGWRKAQSQAYVPDARMVVLTMIIESLVIDPDVWKTWFATRAPFNVFLDPFGRAWLRMPLPSGNSRLYPISRALAELAAGLDEAELRSLMPEHLATAVNKLAGKAQAVAAVATFGQLLSRIQSAMAPDVPGLVLGYADGSLASVSMEEMCLERQDGAGPTLAAVKAWHEQRAKPEKSETRTTMSSMRAGKNGAMAGVADFRKALSEALALLEDRRGQKPKKEAGTQEGQGSESPSTLGPINRFKARIVERWDDLVASPALPPMCSRLASWMHTLADLGQAGGDPYAPKTLKNYWYSWGLRLLEEMEDMDPRDLSPEEFEELYLQVVEDAEVVNRQHLYPPLRNLHRYLVAEHGVCDIDWTDLRVATDQALTRIDANLVHHAEYLRALELLSNDKEVSERIAALQSTALVLLYRCGMRINEVLGLRDSDIYRHDGRWHVRVAGNRFRMLQTENSRRTIVILEALEASEEKALASWSGHVKHFASGRDIKPLFSAGTTGDERAELIPRRTIALRIGQALRLATRDPSTRIHHFRHAFATRLLLAGLDVEPPNASTDKNAAKARRAFVATVRDVLTSEPDATRRFIWAVAVMMGHASPAGTTLRTYFHGGHELLKGWHANSGWRAGQGVDPVEWHVFAAGVKLKTMQRLRQRAGGTVTREATEAEWSRLRRVGDGARARMAGRLPAISLMDGTTTLVNADKLIDHARRFGRADGLADSLFVAESWVEKVIRAADEQSRKWDVPGPSDEFCWFDGAAASYSPHQIEEVEKALKAMSEFDAKAMRDLGDLLRRRLDPRKDMISVESVEEFNRLSKVVGQLLEQKANIKLLVPGRSVGRDFPPDAGTATAVPGRENSAKESEDKRQKPRRAYAAVEGLEAAEAIADLAREMGFSTEPFGRVVAARTSRHSRTQVGDRAGLTIGQNDSDRLRTAKVFTRVMAIAAVVDAVNA
jgi:integrase